jgi:hypothetical protein
MESKEAITKDKKKIDQLPDSFSSEEEAGEFWDTHSASDYIKHLKSVDEDSPNAS